MAVIGVAGVEGEEILAVADGFAHARVQLAGGRGGEAQFEFGMVLHPNGAESGFYALFQVVAAAEGVIFETRAGQGSAWGYLRVVAAVHHEQVVIARVAVHVSGLTLDQVAQHIVGDSCAQATDHLAGMAQRLVEHKGYGVMKLGGGRAQLQRQRVDIGTLQERSGQTCGEGFGIVALTYARGMSGGDDDVSGGRLGTARRLPAYGCAPVAARWRW